MRGMRSGIFTWEQSFPEVLLVCVLPVFSLSLDPPSLRVDVCDPPSLAYGYTHSVPGCLRHQLQLRRLRRLLRDPTLEPQYSALGLGLGSAGV